MMQKAVITISIVSLVKDSFMDPKKLLGAKSLKKGLAFWLFFLLSLTVSIPLFLDGYATLQKFSADAGLIADKIPSFTISDSELQLDNSTEKGFIYKTDTVLLAFDSQEVYTQREIEKEMSSPDLILSLVFSKDAFTLYAQDVSFRLPYEQAADITDQSFQKLLRNFSSDQLFSGVIMLLFSLFISSFSVLLTLMIIALFANVLTGFMRKKLPLGEILKMALVASVVPVLFFSLLNGFDIYPMVQDEAIALIGVFYFYKALKD
ncbi:DUF1189 family protein [Trichococcus pasteurii]|uniref:DUF1189 domain-containing protein n=1 Tax=Trichococcus pasteurii TaxID=43064 RepID=A0A1W1ID97_9LACT|nr:DUF1189 family protein [Trichococcus pasteurii]SFE40852.1 Protein of unknown function [Trichococcus pasteurii]SLM50733.1 Hypothetical protein TPAS_405 [Trichococcus pasteurii]SSB91614.1 Hypothetical protein TPAS_405 [Trichococcus pasteurii]